MFALCYITEDVLFQSLENFLLISLLFPNVMLLNENSTEKPEFWIIINGLKILSLKQPNKI